VALSGGYDTMRYRVAVPFTDGANFQAEYQMLWIEYARAQVRLARLQAERGSGSELDTFGFSNSPVAPEVLSELLANEKEQLETSRADHEKELAFLQQATKNAADQVAVMAEQEQKERQGLESDTNQVNRLLEFNQRGTVTADRVVAERRTMLFSSTRLLQTIAQSAQVKRERSEALRRLDHSEDARRLQLMQQIQDTEANIAALRIKIKASGDKLLYAGGMRSQIARGWSPDIVIVRRGPDGLQQISGTEDTVLQPGDTVEVTLRIDPAVGIPIR
jgi:polysaccharide export outer membrane protein